MGAPASVSFFYMCVLLYAREKGGGFMKRKHRAVIVLLMLVLTICFIGGCGKKKTGSDDSKDDTSEEIAETKEAGLQDGNPEEEDIEQPIMEENAETGNEAIDFTSPDYVYVPSYNCENIGDEWPLENIIIDRPADMEDKPYRKDEFGLPMQEYFWINDNTFDTVGYYFACGASYVSIMGRNQEGTGNLINAYFDRQSNKGVVFDFSGTSRPDWNAEVFMYYGNREASEDTPPNGGLDTGWFSYQYTDELAQIKSRETNELVYAYDQNMFPPQKLMIDKYYISILPMYINAALNSEAEGDCLLDGYGILHHNESPLVNCTEPFSRGMTEKNFE